MTNIDKEESDDVGHDDNGKETSVDCEDDMSELTRWFLIELLWWKKVSYLKRRLIFLVASQTGCRCGSAACGTFVVMERGCD